MRIAVAPTLVLFLACSASPPGVERDSAVVPPPPDASVSPDVNRDTAVVPSSPDGRVDPDGPAAPEAGLRMDAAPDGPSCPPAGTCKMYRCDGSITRPHECQPLYRCDLPVLCESPDILGGTIINNDFAPPYTLLGLGLDNARCVLRALRDGTPSVVTWRINPGGSIGRNVEVAILADRRALWRHHFRRDFLYSEKNGGVFTLREPAYFESCLTKTASDDVVGCLENAVIQECRP